MSAGNVAKAVNSSKDAADAFTLCPAAGHSEQYIDIVSWFGLAKEIEVSQSS